MLKSCIAGGSCLLFMRALSTEVLATDESYESMAKAMAKGSLAV